MGEERNWKRIRDRLALQLPVRVRVRETADFEWTEMTRLTDVTPFGAAFTLKRPMEKGRLVHMTIPMPRQLRVFDHTEDQYRVWAIVRYLRSETTPQGTVFIVGVAFIGKRPPASYEQEPSKRYNVTTTAQGLLVAEEMENTAPTRDQRVDTRHNIPVDMLLEVLDENGAVAASERTVSENIAIRGATLFTTFDIARGRFVRLTSDQYGVTAHAAVRSKSVGADGIARIHVEFIDKEWPL